MYLYIGITLIGIFVFVMGVFIKLKTRKRVMFSMLLQFLGYLIFTVDFIHFFPSDISIIPAVLLGLLSLTCLSMFFGILFSKKISIDRYGNQVN